jgi:hypothetical protein
MAGSDLTRDFFLDRPLKIGRCLNAIEVGSRDRREQNRAYACAKKATDNLLESHRRFIETESLAKRVLALAEIQNPTAGPLR